MPVDPPYIRLFDPHRMDDEQIEKLATGYKAPLGKIISAIEDRLLGVQQQHAFLTAPRGFGKSFLMRCLQIRIRRDYAGLVRPVLLPEEGYSLRLPHHFLRRITEALTGEPRPHRSLIEEEELCSDPAGESRLWLEEYTAMDSALEATVQSDETGPRLIVASLENLEWVLASAFERTPGGKELFRKLLADPTSRLMVVASTSRVIDQKRLAKLFPNRVDIKLDPWPIETCLAYFDNASRYLRAGAPMTDKERRRARAVSVFIGGTPRLAATVGRFFLVKEPFEAVDLLDRVTDDFKAYYKARFDALSPRARDIFHLMVAYGEPRTKSELSEITGYRDRPNAIGAALKELQDEMLFVGTDHGSSAAVRFRISDRIMVHWYKTIELRHDTGQSSLDLLLPSLVEFYTSDEFAEIGERLELIGRSDIASKARELGEFARSSSFHSNTRQILRAAPVLLAIADRLQERLVGPARDAVVHLRAGRLQLARRAIPGGAPRQTLAYRVFWRVMGILTDLVSIPEVHGTDNALAAYGAMEAITRDTESDPDLYVLVARLTAGFGWNIGPKQIRPATTLLQTVVQVDTQSLGIVARLWQEVDRTFLLINNGDYREAIVAARKLAYTSSRTGRREFEARALDHLSYALMRVGDAQAAIDMAQRCFELARQLDLPVIENEARVRFAFSLGRMKDWQHAAEAFETAMLRADQVSDDLGWMQAAYGLAAAQDELGENDAALSTIAVWETRAERLSDSQERGSAALMRGHVLNRLRRFREAARAAEHALALGQQADDGDLQLDALRLHINTTHDGGDPEGAVLEAGEALAALPAGSSVTSQVLFVDTVIWVSGESKAWSTMLTAVQVLVTCLSGSEPESFFAEYPKIVSDILSNLWIYVRRIGDRNAWTALSAELAKLPPKIAEKTELLESLDRIHSLARVLASVIKLEAEADGLQTVYPNWPDNCELAGTQNLLGKEAGQAVRLLRSVPGSDQLANLDLLGVRTTKLPFYNGVTLIELSVRRSGNYAGVVRALVGLNNDHAASGLFLDGTNEPIYATNQRFGIVLKDSSQAQAYIQFFLRTVVGREFGSFRQVTALDDLPFSVLPTPEQRAALAAGSTEMTLEPSTDGTGWRGKMSVLLQPIEAPAALFRCGFMLGLDGQWSIDDGEELLVEGLAVRRRIYDGFVMFIQDKLELEQIESKPYLKALAKQIHKSVGYDLELLQTKARLTAEQLRDRSSARKKSSDIGAEVGAFLMELAARYNDAVAIRVLVNVAASVWPKNGEVPSWIERMLDTAASFVEQDYATKALESRDPDIARTVAAIFAGSEAADAVDRRSPRRRQRRTR